MTTQENINDQLLKELKLTKETGKNTSELHELYLKLIKEVSPKYPFLNEDDRRMCEAFAFDACCRLAIKFNPEKSNNAYAYVKTIIRSSFAGTIVKISKTKIKL